MSAPTMSRTAGFLFVHLAAGPAIRRHAAVFQDRQLPSSAPRFSADGRWLSYISPSSQTLQVYELGGDNTLSLRLSHGHAGGLEPRRRFVLVLGSDRHGAAPSGVYDMTTARKADLSGAADDIDYHGGLVARWPVDC